MEQKTPQDLLKANATQLPEISDPSFASNFGEFGKYQLVLIGDATHGTHEFYEARAKITQFLIEKYDFNILAIEADWPDAEIIDRYVRRRLGPQVEKENAFSRFPRWMWRNREVQQFVEWLRGHNADLPKQRQVGFYGLDLYSLDTSIEAAINYLTQYDPEMANLARQRYSKVLPFLPHLDERPENIRAMVASTEAEVVSMLRDLLKRRLDDRAQRGDTEEFHTAEQNARLISGKRSAQIVPSPVFTLTFVQTLNATIRPC
jgi:erythromycin esterase-like protein